ncbi:hypothetical protein CKO25_07210 [Thiocapsa imhoffii]|uniref:Uncharacterized protein n=1 Tax=Thiocapsa imhoffii TaxID=382777 RepID=A0A9X0WH16_9GAMM|nr:hypothetical protein [Thiocapsa imhoffii]
MLFVGANAAASRETSIRLGHPNTLHLLWATSSRRGQGESSHLNGP